MIVKRKIVPTPWRACLQAGGRPIGHYLTFGVIKIPGDRGSAERDADAAVLIAAASSGGVTDLRTTVALTSVEAKGVFAAASDLAPSFRSRGGT